MVVLGSLLMTIVSAGAAGADAPQAPPMLSPAAANAVATACPSASAYADALVAGATLEQATAGRTLFGQCAKNAASADEPALTVAVAAADLSAGLLSKQSVLIARAGAETNALRRNVLASDAQIRTWVVIPDTYDPRSRIAYFDDFDCAGDVGLDAAYINLAARSGTAWIREQRTARQATGCAAALPSASAFQSIGRTPFTSPPITRPTAAPDEQLQRPVPGIPPR